ncbi:MAG TPA: nitroreductase family deazaflavin-dependent oxidoreductase [Pilimelia sp.]|nr:nitroreductase family deazaflavin-dependent oxidoreductase [Pilimelia sp.]
MTRDHVRDNQTGWVAKHIQRYVATDGAQGHDYHGYPTLLLTTRGRKTGDLRRTALIYGRDGDRYVLVGSNGGASAHPGWYHNIVAEPAVLVQVRADRFAAVARVAEGAERRRLFDMMVGLFPTYATYAAGTARSIPVVILTPAGPVPGDAS